MADARRMGKSELFSHFAERFEMKRTQAREFFDALSELAEKELKRSGEFVLPGMVKLVVQKRKARMGRNPATGEAIKIPAKTVVGVVYLRGAFYYHAWSEVWIGDWVSIDSVLDQFPADATHIKFLEGEIDRQMDILQLIGNLKISVIEAS